jgi:hypothetical protein
LLQLLQEEAVKRDANEGPSQHNGYLQAGLQQLLHAEQHSQGMQLVND